MKPLRTLAVAAVGSLLAGAATVAVVHAHRARTPGIPAALIAAVRHDVVRADSHASELSYSSGIPNPVMQLGAEALAQVSSKTHLGLPSTSAVAQEVSAEIGAGRSPVLIAESLALSTRALSLGPRRFISPSGRPGGQPWTWSVEGARGYAAGAELSGNTTALCADARASIAHSLLRAVLLWPLSGCAATASEQQALRSGWSALGEDSHATRALGAAYRITGDATYAGQLRADVARRVSLTYPHFMTSDDADAVVLAALSGVTASASDGITGYVFAVRMTRGGMVDAGSESGLSVGFAAALVRQVLHRDPMVSDPDLALRGADSPEAAAEAAYSLAAQGHRAPTVLDEPGPVVAQRLRSFPGMPGLFLSSDCSSLTAAIPGWVDLLKQAGQERSIATSPTMSLLLSVDAAAITHCKPAATAAGDAIAKVDRIAADAVEAGSRPTATIEASWAASRIACLTRGASAARAVTRAADFDLTRFLARATSTDELYYSYRLYLAARGQCADAMSPL